MIGLIGFQLLEQGVVSDVLNIDIDRGDYIVAILRFYFIAIIDRFPLALGNFLFQMSSLHSGEVFAKSPFESHFEYISLSVGTFVTHNTVSDSPQGIFARGLALYHDTPFVSSQGK